MCRVTIGHLRVTMDHLRLTIGYLKATVVHIRVTLGHLRVTELHPKVRQTCSVSKPSHHQRLFLAATQYTHLEAGAHLASPLEDVLDEVLAPAPHLVALLHEVLAEPHPVGAVRAEGRGLKQAD